MFARTLRVGSRRICRSGVQTSSISQKIPRRRYSNAGSAPPVTNAPSPVAALGGLSSELEKLSPRFDIDASQIHIIKDPSDFYETLKACKKRKISYSFSFSFFLIVIFFLLYTAQYVIVFLMSMMGEDKHSSRSQKAVVTRAIV